MAKFVKDLYDLVEFLAGKNIATKYAPEKIDLVTYNQSLSLFLSYYDHYVKTQKIAAFMKPFVKQENVQMVSGIGDPPSDLEFIRYVTDLDGKRIELIEDNFWANRANRKLGGPDVQPIIRYEDLGQPSKQFEVLPHDIPNILVYYFKKPAKPKYAYTTQGTRYVYDDTNSVDIEWSQLLYPEFTMRILNGLGINLRENQVIQYTQMMKAEEGSK